MTDTELILKRMDELKEEIQGVRTELKEEIQGVRTELKEEIQGVRTELKEEIQGVRTELKDEIQGLRVEMEDHYAVLADKVEAVRRAVFGIKERMDILEFVLHTEIKHTYDLALENAKQIKILMAYKDRLSGVPAV